MAMKEKAPGEDKERTALTRHDRTSATSGEHTCLKPRNASQSQPRRISYHKLSPCCCSAQRKCFTLGTCLQDAWLSWERFSLTHGRPHKHVTKATEGQGEFPDAWVCLRQLLRQDVDPSGVVYRGPELHSSKAAEGLDAENVPKLSTPMDKIRVGLGHICG